jgi:hypothetical protein
MFYVRVKLYVTIFLFGVFIGLIFGLLGLVAIRPEKVHPVWKVALNDDGELSFDEAYALAERFGNLAYSLPAYTPMKRTTDLFNWAIEVMPQFQYEGIIDGEANLPSEVDFKGFLDGGMHNHVLGVSDCENFAYINYRVRNPVSYWYGMRSALFTLVHEIAHVQQGTEVACNPDAGRAHLVEPAAELMAMEVMSGLANSGNDLALYAVAWELYGMSASSATALASTPEEQRKIDDLLRFYRPDSVSEAARQKANRIWAGDPDRLISILRQYNLLPLSTLVHSGGIIAELATPLDEHGQHIILSMDDTMYLVEHLEQMAADYIKRDREKE